MSESERECEMNCNQARDLLSSSPAREATKANVSADRHLQECNSCNAWSKQMNEIATAASSLPHYDVPESLTQNIMKAVEAEPVHHGSVLSPVNVFQILIAAAMCAFMMFETAEDLSGLISWAIGLGIVYSISLLVRSNREAEAA